MISRKQYIITALFACLLLCIPTVLQAKEAAKVRSIIAKVNNYWQRNNTPERNAFWDNAAYHTGNMEAYRLTGNEEWLAYSLKWAEHNEWKGAKGNDKSKWKYNYGETDNHVLFGDWQICFQTYADLYNILPDDRRIRRARQVMEYEMSTPKNDYWWWSDGLYMVMPVMTKLHKITGNPKYLEKLYEYILYSDSIMYDADEGLYYRDAKYVYPKHKSANGKKDFGHVATAGCLQDLRKCFRICRPATSTANSLKTSTYVLPMVWWHVSSRAVIGAVPCTMRRTHRDRKHPARHSLHTVFCGA